MQQKPFAYYAVTSIFTGITVHISAVYLLLSWTAYALIPVLFTVLTLAFISKKIDSKPSLFKIVYYGLLFFVPLLYCGPYIYKDYILPVFFGY